MSGDTGAVKPSATDDPDFEQVRSLLRAQYAELGPKQPNFVARLAQRFQPEKPASEPEWVVQAVPKLAPATEADLPPAKPFLPASSPVLQPVEASAAPLQAEQLSAALDRLEALTAELGELADAPLADLAA